MLGRLAVASETEVVITEFDDALEPYADDRRGEKALIDCSVHVTCESPVQVVPSSRSHNAIVCTGLCRLRVAIPVGITTLGQLRQHFQRFNK